MQRPPRGIGMRYPSRQSMHSHHLGGGPIGSGPPMPAGPCRGGAVELAGRYQGLVRHSALDAGSRGLAGRHGVEGASAPTGIVHALYAKWILRYAGLGRSGSVIDREQACCSEQRGEGYTDHFRTIMAGATLFIEAFDIGSGSRRCLERQRPATASRRHEFARAEIIRSPAVRYANSALHQRFCSRLTR